MASVSLVQRHQEIRPHPRRQTGLNLEVQATEFFVILGPAGAGKTSILKMIAGIEEALPRARSSSAAPG